jgi:flagellar biosynthesis protein FliR
VGEVFIPVDGTWAIGFVLAMTRVAAFAIASPLFGRGLPVPARTAFTVAMALALTHPVVGVTELGELVAAAAVNVGIGLVLGYVSGLILHLFASAGGIIDIISGLAVSSVFDPMTGNQGGVFGRMFHLVGMTMFVVLGGLGLLVGGLIASVRLLPLAASAAPDPGLGDYVVQLTSTMVRSGLELALPVMGVMLMLELALGLAARFAPQANVFLLGLPAKLLAALMVVGSAWVLFPDAVDNAQRTVETSIETVLRGFGA